MSQNIYNDIVPTVDTGTTLAAALNAFRDAMVSGMSGDTRPTKLTAGGFWVDTSLGVSDNKWILKLWTGTLEVTLLEIKTDSGQVSIPSTGNTFDILKESDNNLGPVLTFIKRRIATNGQVKADDFVGTVDFKSHTNLGTGPANDVSVAGISAVATEDHTATNLGSALLLQVIPTGTAVKQTVVEIDGTNTEVKNNLKVTNTVVNISVKAVTSGVVDLALDSQIVHLTATGDSVIKGFTGTSTAVILVNTSPAAITLEDNSGDAAAGNRISTPNGEDLVIVAGDSIVLTKATMWKVVTSGHYEMDELKRRLALATSTGVIQGLAMSVNGDDDTTFDIAPGIYEIADLGNVLSPSIITVNYPGSTGNAVTNLATHDVTYISLNAVGGIVQTTSYPGPASRRMFAFNGRLNHNNRTSILFADTFPDYKISPIASFYDLVDAIAPFRIDDGLQVTPNGANLSIDVSAGSVFFRSDNYTTNPNNPHTKTYTAMTVAPLRKMTSTDRIDTSDVTVVEPGYYDVGGVRTVVPGAAGAATIQRIYKYKSGAVLVQYGQTVYAGLNAARNALLYDRVTTNPTVAHTGVLIAYLIVTKGCTNLSATNQAIIVPANRFGGAGGGGGGGGTGSGVITVADLTARDAIDSADRKAGETIVYVTSEQKTYQLVGGITNSDWQTLVTNSNSLVITNKDVDGGTASNTSRLTIPKGTYSAIRALNRKEGTISFNTQDKKLLRDDGVNLNPIPVFDNLDVFAQEIASDRSDADFWIDLSGADMTFMISQSPVIGQAFRVAINSAFGPDTFNIRKVYEYPVPHVMRGQRVQMTYDYHSDVEQGGIAFEIIDMTNSKTLVATTETQARPAPTGIATKGFIFFNVPDDCAELRINLKRVSGAPFTNSKVFWFNNLELKKFSQTLGPVITDWQSYTPTISNGGSGVFSTNFRYRRVGSNLEVQGIITTTNPGTGSSIVTASLPAGLVVDASVIPVFNESRTLGSGNFLSSSNRYPAVVVGGNSYTPGNNTVAFVNSLTNTGLIGSNFAASTQIGFTFTVPIQGWSSTARYADYTLNQDVTAVASISSFTPTTTETTVPLNIKVLDTANIINTTTGRIKVPSSGVYEIDVNASCTGSGAAGAIQILRLKNYTTATVLRTSSYSYQASSTAVGWIQCTIKVSLNAGDEIELLSSYQGTITTPSIVPVLTVTKLATSQQLFAPIGPIPTVSLSGGSYTVQANDTDIYMLSSATATTVTLPSAALSTGRSIAFYNRASTNLLTLNTVNSESIVISGGSVTSYVVGSDGSVTLTSTGVSWFVSSNSVPRRIVKTYQSGSSWYEVYSDGWVRQGGQVTHTGVGTTSVALLVNMLNASYKWMSSQESNENSYPITTTAKTTSNFTARFPHSTSRTMQWEVEGYGNSAAVKALGANPNY